MEANVENLTAFVSEAETMRSIPFHPNIITFYGISIQNEVMIVTGLIQ